MPRRNQGWVLATAGSSGLNRSFATDHYDYPVRWDGADGRRSWCTARHHNLLEIEDWNPATVDRRNAVGRRVHSRLSVSPDGATSSCGWLWHPYGVAGF